MNYEIVKRESWVNYVLIIFKNATDVSLDLILWVSSSPLARIWNLCHPDIHLFSVKDETLPPGVGPSLSRSLRLTLEGLLKHSNSVRTPKTERIRPQLNR